MRLNSSQKFFLLGLISAGLPASKIKQTFFDRYFIRLTSPAISYHKKRRGNKGNAGRPLKTTSSEDQVIYEVVREGPLMSWRKIKQIVDFKLGKNLSMRTLRRRMKKLGISTYRCAIKPKITPQLAENRKKFARKFLRKPEFFFRNILFADEAKICLHSNMQSKIYCKRLKGEKLRPDLVRGVVKFRGGGRGVGFWLGVGYRGNGLLVFHGVPCKLKASQYVEILQENFEDSAEILNIRKSECYLLHDRDPSHIGGLTQNYIGRERIRQILLPGNSPDLNVKLQNLIFR